MGHDGELRNLNIKESVGLFTSEVLATQQQSMNDKARPLHSEPASTVILDFLASRALGNIFLLFLCHQCMEVCCCSPHGLRHIENVELG